MEYLTLSFFCAVAAFGIVWGLRSPRSRVAQMPFIMGLSTAAYLIPQALVIVSNPRLVPEGAASGFYVWSSLCMIMAYYGYMRPTSPRRTPKRFVRNVTMQISMVLMAIATLCFLMIYATSFSSNGSRMELGSLFAILYTGVKLSIPALTLSFFNYNVSDRRLINKIVICIGLVIVLYFVLVLGRRQWVFFLLYSAFFPALLLLRFRVRILTILVLLILSPMVMLLLPAYRDSFPKGVSGIKAEIAKRPPSQVVAEYISGIRQIELSQTILIFDTAAKDGDFGYGSGFWDGMISLYIPSTFVGRDFKESLMVRGNDYDSRIYDLHGEDHMNLYYTSKSGFSDSFTEFSIFGLFLYYFMGRIFRWASHNWFRRREPEAGIFLCLFAYYPALLVYGQWTVFLPMALPALAIYLLIVTRLPIRKLRFSRKMSGGLIEDSRVT